MSLTPPVPPGSEEVGPVARSRSLRDHAYERLRDDILSGRLDPGQRLVERDVGESLGVSRITVREAFHQLESEGLVRKQARRGVVVTELSYGDVRDLFEVMESLEVLATRLAAERRSRADLQVLRQLLDEAAAALAAGDERLMAVHNAEFHRQITRAGNNELLAMTMRPLEGLVQRVFVASREVTDLARMQREHEELYEVIEAGDADAAAELASHHMSETRKPTLRMIRRKA
jgi:DNA-binding GntR family transcriptional regulator